MAQDDVRELVGEHGGQLVLVLELHHATYPDTTFILSKPVSVEPYSIACKIGDPESLRWLNLVLHHMRLDGRLEELHAKYGLEDAGN